MVYGCDPAWWRYRKGLPEFTGLKVAWKGANLNEYPDLRTVEIALTCDAPIRYADTLRFDKTGVVGGGGNSGFQALNLALQFGANRILLIGFDMHDRGGVHWYGRNNWPMANNPMDDNFRRWIFGFNKAVPVLRDRGVEVVNCSPLSALSCFRTMTLEEAL